MLEQLQPAGPYWGTQGSAPALGTPSLVLNQCTTSLQEDAAAKAFAAYVAFKIYFIWVFWLFNACVANSQLPEDTLYFWTLHRFY